MALRLITSAAYVDQELSAEFGQLPPAFLPVGVSRLYELQVASLGAGGPIHLTVPEGFVPLDYDSQRLHALGVTLVPVPEGLRLGESVVFAINVIAMPGPMQLLHGDTLIEDLPLGSGDLIAISAEGDDYSWAAVALDGTRVAELAGMAAGAGHDGTRPVACGYFTFSDNTMLVRALTRARGDFLGGLNRYAADRLVTGAWVERWRDFGHIQTYFRSRRAITTARAFNTLQIDATIVRKSSADAAKMDAEANWLASVPPALQPYTARLIDRGAAHYDTLYQYAPTLSELFVFSSTGRPTWLRILESCQAFLDACATCVGPGSGDAMLEALAVGKTTQRLERYARETGFDITAPNSLDGRSSPSLMGVAAAAAAALDLASGRRESVMHGDFCFSNILYDSRAARISVIDPRGFVHAGMLSIYGDPRYDLAKLSHSVAGRYDHILAGHYALRRDGSHAFSLDFDASPRQAWLQGAMAELQVDGIRAGSPVVQAVVIGLFLSMLPLHADRPDRQAAFIANALRLHRALEASA